MEDYAEVTESFTPTSPPRVCHSGRAQDLKCRLALLTLWSMRQTQGRLEEPELTGSHWKGPVTLSCSL